MLDIRYSFKCTSVTNNGKRRYIFSRYFIRKFLTKCQQMRITSLWQISAYNIYTCEICWIYFAKRAKYGQWCHIYLPAVPERQWIPFNDTERTLFMSIFSGRQTDYKFIHDCMNIWLFVYKFSFYMGLRKRINKKSAHIRKYQLNNVLYIMWLNYTKYLFIYL